MVLCYYFPQMGYKLFVTMMQPITSVLRTGTATGPLVINNNALFSFFYCSQCVHSFPPYELVFLHLISTKNVTSLVLAIMKGYWWIKVKRNRP